MSQPATKTARERAQEAVDRKDRKIKRLTDRRDTLKADLTEIERDIEIEQKRRAYLAASPDLADDAQRSIEEIVETNDLPATGTQA